MAGSRESDFHPNHSTRSGTLHHVEINVSNRQRSVEFWGWLLGYLGYKPYQNWVEGRSWCKGETYVVLVQTESDYFEPHYQRKRTGLNHLAFHAASRQQVDELADLLRTRGTHVLYEDRHPYAGGAEHYAVFFEDPDRLKIEVVAP
ncbi:VOC family protein [Ferroacidibacillus organovorans]|uniref:VOC family protein n=1 Tax=Ferroacidibacillus organovorans TaxID=1765683 RepID=UPI0015C42E50|nr:VOC family protein [Ferroacidibacillus organovorans]